MLALSLLMLRATPIFADDLQSSAQHLSDSAFSILNSITSDSSKSAASDVMGAIASFAGDAQTLAATLASGDRQGASSAMTALIADRRAVDEALIKNPRAIDSSKWSPLKAELASIQDRVPSASTLTASAAVVNRLPFIFFPNESQGAGRLADSGCGGRRQVSTCVSRALSPDERPCPCR